jgi:hypothetical protein
MMHGNTKIKKVAYAFTFPELFGFLVHEDE